MKVGWRIIDNLEEMKVLKDDWDAILEESGGESVFLTWEWIVSWLEIYGEEGEPFILWGEGEGWKGIFPLFRRFRPLPLGKLKILSFVGEPLSDRCDFIITGDRQAAIGSFISFCLGNKRYCDLMRLRQIPASSPNADIFKSMLAKNRKRCNCRGCDQAPYIPLPGSWDAYLTSRSRSFKKKIRKYFRNLRQEGSVRIGELSLSPKSWKIILEIQKRSHKIQKGIAFFERPGIAEFIKILLPRLQQAGRLKFVALYLNDVPIAYDISFKYKNKIWSYDSAFDRSYATYGVGHLLLYLLIEDAVREGCREFDLLRGDESYKFSWADRKRNHLEFLIFPGGIISFMVRCGFGLKRLVRFLLKKEFRVLGQKGFIKILHRWLVTDRGQNDSKVSVTAITRKGGIHLRVLTRREEISEIAKDWNHLIDKNELGAIFMSYEWVISWLEVYGDEGEIMVLAAYRKNELIGICPLILRRSSFLRRQVRILEFIGSPQSDRFDIIVREKKEVVLKLFLDYLWEIRSRWTILRFREIFSSSINLTIMEDLLRNRNIHYNLRTCSQAPFLTLNKGWDDYLKGRSKKFRNRMQSDLRKIRRAGEVRLETVVPTPEVWGQIIEIDCQSPKATRGTNLFSDPRNLEFMRKVMDRFEKSGWSDIKYLLLNGYPIAYRIDFLYNNRLLLYNGAFRSNYGGYHPGYVFQGLSIPDCVKKGIKEIDFLRGGERYKSGYTNELRYNREIIVFSRNPAAQILRWGYLSKEFLKRLTGRGIAFGRELKPRPLNSPAPFSEISGWKEGSLILIVDDDQVIMKKLRYIIGQGGYRILSAPNGKKALELIKKNPPDLIISDIMMPEMNGYEFCRHIRSHPDTELIPFVFLTSKEKIDDRIEGIKLGADAFLTKTFQPSELLVTVRTALLRHRFYLEQARTDSLTGLPNRKSMLDEMIKQIKRFRQNKCIFSLALLDLDDFKAVNDRYGHPAGDLVLRQFSEEISRRIRAQDKIGRWGGEEFLILYPDTGKAEAGKLLDKIRKNLVQLKWEGGGGGKELSLRFSAGLAELARTDQDPNQVIDRADRALYRAKEDGKNRVLVSEQAGFLNI